MGYAFWADVIVGFHVAYVGYILVGQAAIFLGMVRKWRWTTNVWFRLSHLTAIAVVALEAIGGIACPLTVWEDQLRRRAGQDVTEGSFIGRWLHGLLFYDLPPWVFTTCYVSFALLVLVTLFWSPPRWAKARRLSARSARG